MAEATASLSGTGAESAPTTAQDREVQRWCVQGMHAIYDRDAELTKRVLCQRSIMEEPRYRVEELRTLSDIWPIFEQYGLGWMTQPSRRYSSELVREFYASYVASVGLSTPVGQRYILQPVLTHVMVRGTRVDISEETIHRFLFGPDRPVPVSTAEFDHRLSTVRDRVRMRDTE